MDSRSERCETVIVGGGQAGLAVGYHLARRGRPFHGCGRGPLRGVWCAAPVGDLRRRARPRGALRGGGLRDVP